MYHVSDFLDDMIPDFIEVETNSNCFFLDKKIFTVFLKLLDIVLKFLFEGKDARILVVLKFFACINSNVNMKGSGDIVLEEVYVVNF